jgi:long-chain fatty acid transport protein
MKKTNRIMRAGVLAALAGWTTAGYTAGFQLIEQNGSGLGNAYSGQAAAAENSSTVYFNPAGMAYLPGLRVSGSAALIRPSAKFNDDGASRSPLGAGTGRPEPAGGDNGGDAGGSWLPLANFYVTYEITPKLWAGFGVSTPFGLKTQYESTFIGRFQSQKVDLKTYDFNPSVAYKVNETFSFGAGVSYQRTNLQLDRSFSLVAASAPESVTLKDGSFGWNVGAMINAGPKTRLGLTYRSAVSHSLTGNVGITGVGNAAAIAKVAFPDTASIALSHHFNDKWQLLSDVTWTRWSRIQGVPLMLTSAGLGASPAGTTVDVLDFQFKDSYRFGVGLNYRWKEDFMWRFGAAYDSTPVPDIQHRTTFLPDNSRTWLSIGGKYQVTKEGTVDFGYAHLFMSDGGIFRNKGTAAAAGQQGIVSGSYKEQVDIVSVQYSHAF